MTDLSIEEMEDILNSEETRQFLADEREKAKHLALNSDGIESAVLRSLNGHTESDIVDTLSSLVSNSSTFADSLTAALNK